MKTFWIILLVQVLCSEGGKIGGPHGKRELILLSTEPFEVPEIIEDNEVDRGGRIINGVFASSGQFPHFSLIFVKRQSTTVQCGAGLIATEWVLTADHCVREAISIELRFGVSHRNIYEQQIYASGLARQTDVDMALIKMKSAVRVTALVKPAFLPRYAEKNDMYVNRMATVSGMGIENAKTSAISSYLKYAELKIMKQSDCSPYYGDVDERRLCAKSTAVSVLASTCPGDSGSPLIIKDLNDIVIVGIVSFGSAYGCDIGYPIGYSRTTHQLDWITSYTGIKLRT